MNPVFAQVKGKFGKQGHDEGIADHICWEDRSKEEGWDVQDMTHK